MNISKNQLKLITSLQQKKYRQKHGIFVAEGVKIVNELLASSLVLEVLFCTDDYKCDLSSEKMKVISQKALQQASFLKSANKVLALFKIPKETIIHESGLTIVLDAINDPGNLGTIIRLCDWFGVSQLVCSINTVDVYNTKVIQASMASFARVSVVYTDISDFLQTTKRPIYAAQMEGDNVYKLDLATDAVLVLGNEANGISYETMQLITKRISIPRFGILQQTESLNVATATAILLSEFRRNS